MRVCFSNLLPMKIVFMHIDWISIMNFDISLFYVYGHGYIHLAIEFQWNPERRPFSFL